MTDIRKRTYQPYAIMLAVYALFIITALAHDSPYEIFRGFIRIITSRSVLLTDYIEVGGIGATLFNSAIVGCAGILMLVRLGVKPNGSIIMALWLTAGFAFFGKNIFNMLPITFGVYLYSKSQKEPFMNYSLAALMSATLSPVVSGISFSGIMSPVPCILLGVFAGVAAGFVFPAVSAFTIRVHGGYNLYNMGFAGGLISTFLVAAFASVGINFNTHVIWRAGKDITMAVLLYVIFAGLIACGIVLGGGFGVIKKYPVLLKQTGRLISDYYVVFGKQIYFNMGLTGAFVTTLMLIMGCDLNGPMVGGIFTVVGFSAFGKHLRNILPLLAGAILSTRVNVWDPSAPSNALAILFSTGLAPIAGHFGWFWGVVAGFLHVNTVLHISFLNGGLNLYNNGYAAGFVALLLVPIITAFKKEDEK